ncbi:MAG: aspartate/glutamate racemase family protein [Paracoccaceae bacterium]
MRPSVSVLQLDTQFPRVPGDVACRDTYNDEIEIIRIPGASVRNIVTCRPGDIDIQLFEDAVKNAGGDVIVTSCGFLSFWQKHLQSCTTRPFISSSLVALDRLSAVYAPQELMILTFDATSLNEFHLGDHRRYAGATRGLSPQMHLRHVISTGQSELKTDVASDEMVDLVRKSRVQSHKHILLECTNMPPYKQALKTEFELPVSDILTEIERIRPNTIARAFL